MPYATWPFNLCQLGRGTAITAGGAIAANDNTIAATTVWRGVFGGFDDTRERQTTQEDVGTMASAERTADTKIMATVPMPQTTLTFEQILHVLEASMGQVTPTGSGPYTYAYSVALGATPPTIRPYTLRVGNVLAPADIKIIPGCWVQEWTMSGEAGGFWTIEATWQGQRGINGSFTPAIALPAVQDAIFSNTNLYIDASGGAIGTTQISGVLIGATIKYSSGIEWVPPGDGTLYPTRIKIGRPRVTYTLKLELEETGGVNRVAQQRAAFENNTLQLIRLQCAGTSGRTIRWDIAARHDSIGAYEKNGETNTVVTIEGHADYSAADTLMFGVTVINSLAAVP
jgi:hypothetical protein